MYVQVSVYGLRDTCSCVLRVFPLLVHLVPVIVRIVNRHGVARKSSCGKLLP